MKLFSCIYGFLFGFILLRVVEGDGYNDVVEVGQQYTINCTKLEDEIVAQAIWKRNNKIIYTDDGGVLDPSKYEISEREYDLIIHDMDHTTSGWYWCNIANVGTGNSILKDFGIVAIDGPRCPDHIVFDVYDIINLDCDITYSIPDDTDYKFEPNFRWLNGSEDIPGSPGPTEQPPTSGEEIEAKFIMDGGTAGVEHNNQVYTCRVDFDATTGEKPDYEGVCTTLVNVNHPPQGTKIKPKDENGVTKVVVGDVFNCTTSAYPEPDPYEGYWWHRIDGDGDDVMGWQMEVTELHTKRRNKYTCTVNVHLLEDSAEIEFDAAYIGSGNALICHLTLLLLTMFHAMLNAFH